MLDMKFVYGHVLRIVMQILKMLCLLANLLER